MYSLKAYGNVFDAIPFSIKTFSPAFHESLYASAVNFFVDFSKLPFGRFFDLIVTLE